MTFAKDGEWKHLKYFHRTAFISNNTTTLEQPIGSGEQKNMNKEITMMNELIQLIQQYEHDGCFTHANVSDEMICYAETLLSVKLPEQYKSFLKIYGHGGLDGLEILGVGIAGQLVFVDETIAYRKYGLAQNLVVIENCDEWLYCLDCDNGTVVYWEHGYVEHVFPSFHAYFNDRIHDSIENM